MAAKYQCKVMNIKDPVMWILSIVTAFSIWFAIYFINWIITPVFLFIALVYPLLLLYLKTTKVIINNERITKKTIFGQSSIIKTEIKSIGIFGTSMAGRFIINDSDIENTNWVSQKLIFISDNKNYKTNMFWKNPNLIIPYDKGLYEDIKQIVKSYPVQN